MTSPNNTRCQATGQTPAVPAHRDPHQMVQNPLATGWTRTAEQAVTAGADQGAHNVPAPRDVDRWPTSRNGVGRHARVDPWGDPGAYTAGPTRHPQRVRVRRAPDPDGRTAKRLRSVERRREPAKPRTVRVRAVRGRAADMSRPGAAVMGRAVALQTCVLATVENRPHSCVRGPISIGSQAQGWVHHAPSSHRDVPTTEVSAKCPT